MKDCEKCGTENLDDVKFCKNCGAEFAPDPRMIASVETVESLGEELGEELNDTKTETAEVGTRFQDDASIQTFTAHKPQASSKTLYWLLGGCLTLLLIAFIAVAIFLYLNWGTERAETASNSKTEPTTPAPILIDEKTPESKTEESEQTEEPQLDAETDKPEISFTPPVEPTRQGSFSVKADKGWQVSEINTVPSEIFRTSIRGKVFMGGIDKNVSPEGIEEDTDRRLLKQFPTGALLMRTRFANGKVGNIQPATAYSQWENFKNERGRLEFLINDNSPENNKGEFIVTVRMVSVPENQ